jgi:putative membrane protein
MENISLSAAAILSAITLGTSSFAADAISREDKEFLKNAGELGMTEVLLGNLAVERATSAELKALGARLVEDHTKANEELVALALKKGVELTMEPTAAQKKMLANFKDKSGAEFDKELMEHVRKDHEKGLHTFTDAAQDSKDMDIKAFALKNVGVMQQHHIMAGGAGEHAHPHPH